MLGVLPVLLVLGGLSDRIGRKPPIVVALLLSMVATLVMALWPRLEALGVARLLLGVGTALASATGTAYMSELMAGGDSRTSANWVTASTSLGFGLGAALTSLFLLFRESLVPGSFWVQLGLACVALAAVAGLPDEAPRGRDTPMLRLPFFPPAACRTASRSCWHGPLWAWSSRSCLRCWRPTGWRAGQASRPLP